MNNNKTKAIKVKLANLISATPRDMCIRTRINNRSFDLSKFFNQEHLQAFFNFQTQKLELSAAANRLVLERELNELSTVNSFLNYLNENEILIPKTKQDKLIKNFDKYKSIIIDYILNKSDNQKRKIETIIKRNKNILDNTGIHSLYIGGYFLVGSTPNNNIQLNAPLILYPIEVNYEKETCVIKHTNDNKFVVNEKLLSFLKKEYGLDFIISDLVKKVMSSNDVNVLIDEVSKLLKINFHAHDLVISNFVDAPDYSLQDTFKINLNYVLGIFEPTGGALKYDLEKLIEMDIDPFVNKQSLSKTKFINDEINNKPLVSLDGKLNIYQKYATRSALMQNTLIFGPPGTGKSEVITNIIANALIARRSTLVVAEKRVALDVIMDRLQDLASFTLFIDDLKNKTEFYDKIKWIADQLENMYYDQTDIDNAKNLAQIDLSYTNKSHDELKNYFSSLQSLINQKDSFQTTFLDYLSLNKNVDGELLKFIKDNDSLVYLKKMLAHYSFKDISTMFDKVNEYKEFLLKYKINPNEGYNTLKKQKLALTEFQILYNTINFLESYGSKTKDLLKDFTNFLETSKLNHNHKFLRLIDKNPSLLSMQKTLLDQIKSQHHHIFNLNFLKYLVNNYNKVVNFVNKYHKKNESSKQEYLLDFLKKTNFFQLVSSQTENLKYQSSVFVDIMSSFIEIPESNQQYLIDIFKLKNDHILDQNVILTYFNPWLTEPYIKALGETNLTFFTSQELTELVPILKMKSDEYDKINKIINFEREIINNSDYLNIDLQQLVNDHRNNLLISYEHASKKLAQQYLQSLKQILLNMDENSKKKIQEIFAIARRDVKINIPIKELIASYYHELKIIFPIWISLPELIAQLLPLEPDIFDYGIFDEASQIFMERAYPIVYRCKTNIVAGDDKQLKPTSFFINRIDDTMQDYAHNDNDQVESLLDRAKVALWPEYHLRNHYRSVHRDLIQFSNDFIYDHNLHFVTKNGAKNNALEVINVDGVNIEGINEVEANAIFELLKDNIDKYAKIIVVTFGTKQSSYIEQLIQKNSVEYANINDKYNDGSLIISNLENAQGNEADLVILSVTYGKGQLNNYKGNFGPLLLDGGSNRLNVAITRAKDKMIVVKSFSVSEMTFNPDNPNAVILRAFINYCDNIALNQNDNFIKTNSHVYSLIHHDLQVLFDKYLIGNNKYFLVKNYDVGSKIIDFAILEKDTNKTIFALLINKLSFDSSVSSLFENIDNYWFINDRGYNCYLIDEHYWIKNKSIATKQILNYLKSI